MPPRNIILATDETYHIFSRALHQIPIFSSKYEADLFLSATKYYLQVCPPVKFSIYRQQKNRYQIDLRRKWVNLIAYCIMPDHFHFILTQLKDQGIRKYIHRLASSYSHFYNLKSHQKGSVFESKFKAVRIKTQDQLIHLSRYIHLNPTTSYLVKNPQDYLYSSYNIYLKKKKSDFVDPSDVMVDFKSATSYQKFVLNQKDYQRELKQIKHLILE